MQQLESPDPLKALLFHDGLLAVNIVRAEMSTWKDWAAAVFGIAIIAAYFLARFAELPADRKHYLALAVCLAIPYSVTKIALERLRYHRSVGPIAHKVLGTEQMLLVLVLASGFSILSVALMAKALDADFHTAAASVAVGFTASLLAAALNGLVSNNQWISKLLKRRTYLRSFSTLALSRVLALGIVCAITIYVVHLTSADGALAIVISAICLVAFLLTTMIQPALVRFAAQSGIYPKNLIFALIARIGAFLVPLLLAIYLSADLTALALAALLVVLYAAYAVLRLVICYVHSPRIAERTLMFILFAAVFLGVLFPPVGFLIIAAAIVRYYRQAARMTWIIA